MSRKTHKHTRKEKKTRKHNSSHKGKHSKTKKHLGHKSCPNCPHCPPNCPHCPPNCPRCHHKCPRCHHKCPHNCPHCPHHCHEHCKCNLKKEHKLKGGSGCGSCGCPIAPLSYKQMNHFGGKCSMCSKKGGAFYKPIGPMPGPFVGEPWGADLKWPGLNGISGDRNYLANYDNVIVNDPQQQMSMNDAGYTTLNSKVGGYTYGKKKKSSSSSSVKLGGGIVTQDLVNLGRDFSFNVKSAYNAINGYKAPVNPAPYKDQLIHK